MCHHYLQLCPGNSEHVVPSSISTSTCCNKLLLTCDIDFTSSMFCHRHHCCRVRIRRFLDVGWLSFVVSCIVNVGCHCRSYRISLTWAFHCWLIRLKIVSSSLSIICTAAHDDGEYRLLSTCNIGEVLRSKWRRCSSCNSIYVDIPLRRWRRRQRRRGCRCRCRRWQRWSW